MNTLSSKDIFQAEKAASDRREGRNNGYKLARDRDQGWARMTNGVLVKWHVPRPDVTSELPDFYVFPPDIPEGSVDIDGRLYDVEELRKWLRWA